MKLRYAATIEQAESLVVEIPLTKDQTALIDAADYPLISQYSWGSYTDKRGHTYARTWIDGRNVDIHTLLTGHTGVDHMNGDGLDNRRCNLRDATRSQNEANSTLSRNNTSGFKGVSWRKSIEKWGAKIMVQGRAYHLGYFSDPVDAARAYDRAAIEHFGEFSLTNEDLGLYGQRTEDPS